MSHLFPPSLTAWIRLHPSTKFLLYLPAIGWATIIFWFSSRSDLPTLPESWKEFIFKKTAHLLIYAGLYFWLWWGTCLSQIRQNTLVKPLSFRQITILLIIITLYAASDEFHQSFTATRHPGLRDVVIDLIGASTLASLLRNQPKSIKLLKNH